MFKKATDDSPDARNRNDSGDYDPLSADDIFLSDDDSPTLGKNNELTIIKIHRNDIEESPRM